CATNRTVPQRQDPSCDGRSIGSMTSSMYRGSRMPMNAGGDLTRAPAAFAGTPPLGSGRTALPAPGSGRLAGKALERADECRRRFVADVECDRCDARARIDQQPGCELHAPVREILDGRLPDEVHETLVQGGPRQSDAAAELIDRPCGGRAFVQE